MAVVSSQEERLWTDFLTTRNPMTRERLIETYQHLVKLTVGRMAVGLPPSLSREDMAGAGMIALIRAIDNYETGHNARFETYAIALIRGAVLEFIRNEDWVPRSVRKKAKVLEGAKVYLEGRLGRGPSRDEIARHLEVTEDELSALESEVGTLSQVSLEEPLPRSEGLTYADTVSDQEDIHALLLAAEDQARLTRNLRVLPTRERRVLHLYYFSHLTFKEIGQELGISESRAFQLHEQAKRRIRIAEGLPPPPKGGARGRPRKDRQ
jgi:RNA polymerase sigma factor for flagellar operon FliA